MLLCISRVLIGVNQQLERKSKSIIIIVYCKKQHSPWSPCEASGEVTNRPGLLPLRLTCRISPWRAPTC